MVSGGVWMVSGWGLRVSGNVLIPGYQDIAIPNPLANFKLGHTRILPFLPVPSIAKTSMSGVVWMVSGGVWTGSDGVSQCIYTKFVGKLYKSHASSDIAFSSSAL